MREPRSISARPAYARRSADRRSAPAARPSPGLVRRLDDLRTAVTQHTVALRDEGMPLERVLAAMAAIVELAERLEGQPDELGVLLGRVRLWSLAAYVDVPELRNVPRFY